MNLRQSATLSAIVGSLLVLSTVVPAAAADDSAAEVEVVDTPSDLFAPGATGPAELDSAASVDDGGLQLKHSFTGNLNWSVDGLGINGGTTGNLQVEKPANSTVLRAYLVLASFTPVTSSDLSDVRINGAAPTFSDDATDTSYGFRNFLADVTSIIAPTVNAAPAGSVSISMNEGANASVIEGSALVVVFDDPAVSVSSIALYFGTSQTTGDDFTLAFDALSEPQTQDLRMSIGSAYSYGSGQTSTITVNGSTLTEQAGHFDDCDEFVAGEEDESNWTCNDGALITVGGVGDSLDNPTISDPWSTVSDDELYSLSPFVTIGDTEIQVQTLNASGDDNIFMAVFYLDEVELDGATPIAPEDADDELAETGAGEISAVALIALLTMLLGTAAVTVRRRLGAQH